MINVWASHSSAEQNLVDGVESSLVDSGLGIELIHYRKTFIDDEGNPYSEDQLQENEEIGRLINDIGDSRGVVFFLCENFLRSRVCLAELLAVVRHKYNNHFAVVRYDTSPDYVDKLVAAIQKTDVMELVNRSLIRRENYDSLSMDQVEEVLRTRLADKIYTSQPQAEAIKESLKGYKKANIRERPTFNMAAHYRQWVSYGEGRALREHFCTYPSVASNDEGASSESYADYVARELFENGNISNFRQNLPLHLREYVEKNAIADDSGKLKRQALSDVKTFGGYFALLLFNREWVAQQNCLSADRVQVNLRLQDSKNNPVFINIIVAGVTEKVPRLSLSGEWLTGKDCLLKITDRVDIGSGTEKEKRNAYYRIIVDSLWLALYQDEAPSSDADVKESTLLSKDNRGRLIGDFNDRFGKDSTRVAYVEIDQPVINSLAPELPHYLDGYLKELNADIADDNEEDNIDIPMVLFRIDESAPQFDGMRSKLSLLKKIIAVAEGK